MEVQNTANSVHAAPLGQEGDKSYLVTAILSLLVGALGVDRFYVGKVGTGLLKLLTFGGLGIWWLIDVVLIYTGNFRDKQGKKLAERDKNLKASLIVLAVVLVLGIIAPKPATVEFGSDQNEAVETILENASSPALENAQASESPAPAKSVTPAEPAVPAEYTSALKQAKTYAETMHMSKQGVYDQLVSEYGGKFTPEAAQYAIDTLKTDWSAHALSKAKTYQTTMSMSPAAIRDQLISPYGEKFTAAEADYAVQNLDK